MVKKYGLKVSISIFTVTVSVLVFLNGCTWYRVQNDETVSPTSTGLEPLAVVRGKRILFDISHHNGVYPTYADFARIAMNMGYTLVPFKSGPITSAILANYDIVVLPFPVTALTTNEIRALQTWIYNGGRLIAIGDWGDFSGNLNELCTPFGIQFNNDILYDFTNYDYEYQWIRFHRFGKHQITTGLSEIWMLATCSITITNPRIAQGLVFGDEDTISCFIKGGEKLSGVGFSNAVKKSTGSFIVAAASTYGKGKVVCLGDSNVFSLAYVADVDEDCLPDIFEYDNAQFLQNILKWLTPTPVSEWTFMVYCIGDNDLEYYAFKDLNEMEKVGSTDRVNIIVFLDTWNDTGARYYYIHKDSDLRNITSPVIRDLPEQNAGDPNVLIEFLNWTAENYPAKKYALILWNHGSGWKKMPPYRGVCYDYTDSDFLSISELKYALANTHFSLDLIGFDACLMGMVEVAYQIRNFAKVTVGSEEVEPGDGWPYDTILDKLAKSPTMNAASLGREICKAYSQYYGLSGVTLSAIDLSKIDSLAQAVKNLGVVLEKYWSRYKANVLEARNNAEEFWDPDYIDIGSFVSQLVVPSELKQAAAKTMNCLRSATIANFSGRRKCYGLSIYFPKCYFNNNYEILDFVITNWHNFLKLFTSECLPPPP